MVTCAGRPAAVKWAAWPPGRGAVASAAWEPRRSLREIRRTVAGGAGLTRQETEQVEPLAADVRPATHGGRGHLGRIARLRLLACVLGVRFDDLRQRDLERRNRRLAALGGVSLA